MNALVIALTIVVALLTVLVIGLLQSHAAIVRALHDLGVNFDPSDDAKSSSPHAAMIGTPGDLAAAAVGSGAGPMGSARDVIGTDFEGNPMAVAVTHVQRSTLLAFLSSGCLTCHGFWEAFSDPVRRASAVPGASVVAVTKGHDGESPAATAKLASGGLTTVMSTEAWDDYSVPVAPYFILIDGVSNRVVGEGSAATFDQLGSLMGRAAADLALVRANNAPEVSRRDLFGIFTPTAAGEGEPEVMPTTVSGTESNS